MKVLASVLAMAMAVASVNAVAVEPRADNEARCLANGRACKANGSMGYCCSGFCLAQGNRIGRCANRSSAVADEEDVADIEARCLANGKRCKANGSLGICCSGFCLAQGNRVGVCKRR